MEDIVYTGSLFVKDLSEILCVDARIIIKWILQKKNRMLWTSFRWNKTRYRVAVKMAMNLEVSQKVAHFLTRSFQQIVPNCIGS